MATTPAPVDAAPFGRQVSLVLRRALADGVSNLPLAFVAPTLLASFVAVMFMAVFEAVAEAPGFPTDTFVQWIGPAAVLLTAFVGAGYSAGALLADIETGYLDRIRLLPVRASALVIGRALFEGIRVIPPAAIVLTAVLFLGGRNGSSVAGWLAVVGLTALVAVAWNGIYFLVALGARDRATVLGLQPLFMPVVMFSTFFAPTSFMPRWFEVIVVVNPFTHVLDGARSMLGVTTGAGRLSFGLVGFAAIGAVTYALAARLWTGVVAAD
jgi:ABC-2 type transport system permease protein